MDTGRDVRVASPAPMGASRPTSTTVLVVAASLALVAIYVASIRACGPWDPWETHYGEVARQILVRHDPLDLWWRPGSGGPHGRAETTFWSKPPLAFWAMALSMAAFGVGTGADPAEMVHHPMAEIALRLPSLVFGVATVVVIGVVVGRMVSRRAGVLAAFVLATMPQMALVTRQALTDVFALAPVVFGVCAYAVAVSHPARPLHRRTFRGFEITWDARLLPAAALLLIFGVVPLAVLWAHVLDPWTAARVAKAGRADGPYSVAALRAIGWQFGIYAVVAVVLAVRLLRLRTSRQAAMALVLPAAGVSAMAKGLIGPGIVVTTCLVDAWVAGRRRPRLRELELVVGVLGLALVLLPWHHAMWIFRGDRWVNEWIMVNNLARFGSGEQAQAVGDLTYYLRILGPAALPWSAFVPVAFGLAAGWVLRRHGAGVAEAPTPRHVFVRVCVLWTFVSLWAISTSVTKYYHYLVPVLPPAAILTAIFLIERDLGAHRLGVRGLSALVGLGLLYAALHLVTYEPAILAHLTTYLYTGMWRRGAPETTNFAWASVAFAVGLVPWLAGRLRASAAIFVVGAGLVTHLLLNAYLPAASEHWSQRTAFRTYFERRTPDDDIVSWWFYYRGETYFTKGRIWVMKEPDRRKLASYLEDRARKAPEAATWFITIQAHAGRLSSHLPVALRRHVEKVYENEHYVLMRVPHRPLADRLAKTEG
ncbi:MAG: hypothetical protein D6705_17905 [Deltaproteobacteria bacterium]|nr:MAG: hypothetical protein D6705_17905 [Deltaproteobacteria bacterium]